MLILLSFAVYSDEKTVNNEIDATSATISRETTATNQQQLDIKEIDTEELLLQNQNLESSSVEISGENFKEGEDRIIVRQSNTVSLEEELAQGVEKKSFFRRIADFFTGK